MIYLNLSFLFRLFSPITLNFIIPILLNKCKVYNLATYLIPRLPKYDHLSTRYSHDMIITANNSIKIALILLMTSHNKNDRNGSF